MFDIVVIGGGITGLSAAFRLGRRGKKVALVNDGPLGGLIRSASRDGFLLEQGPNVLLEKPDLARLVDDLGLSADKIYPSVERYAQCVWRAGAVHDAPKSIGALLATPLIGAGAKLALPAKLFLPNAIRPAGEDESAADFFSRIVGTHAVDALLRPMLQGIYGGDARKLSARSLFPELWDFASSGRPLVSYLRMKTRSRVFVIRGGMAALVQKLRGQIADESIVSGAVERIEYHGGDAPLRIFVRGRGEIAARHAFITTSGAKSAAFLRDLMPEESSRLSALEYAPLAVVHMSLSGENAGRLRRGAFGVLFPPGMPSGILGVMYNSALFPHVAPHGTHLVTICLGGAGAPDALAKSDEALADAARSEIEAALGIRGESALAVHRWPRAIPQQTVGHFKLVAALRAAEARFPGIRFLGTDCGGVGIADRVRAAEQAAASVREQE